MPDEVIETKGKKSKATAKVVEPQQTEEEPQALVTVEEQKAALNLFGTNDPVEVLERATKVANVLTDLLVKQKMITKIGDKKHVNVEGWQTLGSMLGVMVVVTETTEITEPAKGFSASAEARTMDNRVVGASTAICTRAESKWKDRDHYAILSMAQTRAISKAMKAPLGFIIKIAGFQATPSEEIDDTTYMSRTERAVDRAGAAPQASVPAKREEPMIRADQQETINYLIDHQDISEDARLNILTSMDKLTEKGADNVITRLTNTPKKG